MVVKLFFFTKMVLKRKLRFTVILMNIIINTYIYMVSRSIKDRYGL